MLISHQEYSTLISNAVDGKMVSASFGPRWVSLTEDLPSNKWAIEMVKEMRKKQDVKDS